MALGYPSHDNVTRMHKLFPKVAREPLSLLFIDFKISAQHSGAMSYDSYKNKHLWKIVWVLLGTGSTLLKIAFAVLYISSLIYQLWQPISEL